MSALSGRMCVVSTSSSSASPPLGTGFPSFQFPENRIRKKMWHYRSRTGEAEWFAAPCLLHVAWMVVGSSPKVPPMLVDTSAGMWIKEARLRCWPLLSQQVLHHRWISGNKECKLEIHLGFETQDRHHQNSKNRGINGPTKRTRVLQFF